jgi:hypothetical protein
VVTPLGKRGANYTAMSSSTNAALLEKVVAGQRPILREAVNLISQRLLR